MLKKICSVFLVVICFAITSGVMADSQSMSEPVIQSIQTSVNINQANENELKSLEHIGKKHASAIIAYRKAHGPFKHVEDLANVKGISKAYVEQHRSELTV